VRRSTHSFTLHAVAPVHRRPVVPRLARHRAAHPVRARIRDGRVPRVPRADGAVPGVLPDAAQRADLGIRPPPALARGRGDRPREAGGERASTLARKVGAGGVAGRVGGAGAGGAAIRAVAAPNPSVGVVGRVPGVVAVDVLPRRAAASRAEAPARAGCVGQLRAEEEGAAVAAAVRRLVVPVLVERLVAVLGARVLALASGPLHPGVAVAAVGAALLGTGALTPGAARVRTALAGAPSSAVGPRAAPAAPHRARVPLGPCAKVVAGPAAAPDGDGDVDARGQLQSGLVYRLARVAVPVVALVAGRVAAVPPRSVQVGGPEIDRGGPAAAPAAVVPRAAAAASHERRADDQRCVEGEGDLGGDVGDAEELRGLLLACAEWGRGGGEGGEGEAGEGREGREGDVAGEAH
ncbi:hypothetical protein DFJ74DRAFT_723277, partial [Hyaloraphidium curvatum]